MSVVSLGDLVEIKGGGTPDKGVPDYWNGRIPWASVKDFKSTSLDRTTDFITEAGVKNSATNIIPAGTIIVPTRMAVGKAAISTIELAINQDLKALFPRKTVDTRYLLHALLASSGELERNATGATVKGITLSVLRALRIPLPPLPEQRRIAAILDQADALRRLRRRSLSRLSDLGQAIFHEMFAAAKHADWPTVTIADVVDAAKGGMRTGPFGSQLLHSEFVDEGVAVLGIDNAVSNEFRWAKERHITRGKYASLRRYKVFPGDVLITIMGTCGRVAIVPDDVGEAINTKHLCCITLDQKRCLPAFLHSYFLYHPVARHYLGVRSKGAIMDGLNMGIIKALPLLLPPIAKQREFVDRISKLTAQSRKATDAQDATDALFASLQHRAFRGEL